MKKFYVAYNWGAANGSHGSGWVIATRATLNSQADIEDVVAQILANEISPFEDETWIIPIFWKELEA